MKRYFLPSSCVLPSGSKKDGSWLGVTELGMRRTSPYSGVFIRMRTSSS